MQALCPQCSQRIVIDDAKVPDRPFNVRCPRCQNAVRLPGKGAAPSAPAGDPAGSAARPAPAPAAPPPPVPPPPPAGRPGPEGSGSYASDELRAQMMAQLRREMSADGSQGPQALVTFADPAQAAAVTLTLTRLGYHVETVDDFDDGARLVEQGVYQVVATSRTAAAAGRPETPYQRIARLSPDARRRVFVILVGDEFQSGDGTRAFLAQADLVLHPRDAGTADQVIRGTIAERKRLYQLFDEAQKKFEEAGT
ncbi:MAG TPA: zinc-ribbon domain-containing protein [Vicinamibacteria bacterium]|nr:zinc-ribbon domain-containing protein [Vicinamibacteria bacterium]